MNKVDQSASLTYQPVLSLPKNISAQALLASQNYVVTSGFLKKKDKGLLGNRWTRRFVILTSGLLYVYEDETSASPQERIELHGYKNVSHYISKSKSQQGLWAFQLEPVYSLLPLESFASASERDRTQWMDLIKAEIFKSPSCPLLSSKGNEEHQYDELDQTAIGHERQGPYDLESLGHELKYERLEEDRSVQGQRHRKLQRNLYENLKDAKRNRTLTLPPKDNKQNKEMSLPRKRGRNAANFKPKAISPPASRTMFHVPLPDNDGQDEEEAGGSILGVYDEIDESIVTSWSESSQQNGSQSTSLHEMPFIPRLRQTEKTHPSEVVYSTPKDIISLERMCSLLESHRSREDLNAELKTKAPGTYFIRFSRQGSLRVLTFHCGDGVLKEYRIYKTMDDKLTIERSSEFRFVSTDEFLRFYTVQKPLPDTDGLYLKQGFYYNTRDQIPEELEVENDECV